MNATTKAKAVDILEGMRTIARAHMMDNVGYVDDEVVPRREHAVCRGRKACAIGSLWLAAGIPLKEIGDFRVTLPGVGESGRADFLRHRHALRTAYNALNEAAAAYIEREAIAASSLFKAEVEALFESDDDALYGDNRRKAMLKVIAAAKRKLQAA